ncbi:hypothetical protein HID58_002688 [Brassica napus]|uniref:Uncharacterized protein n=1 Tax=Brassica napus TaxID=3708 RepID=A0ABQ8EN04_BRANA|nr:hypothetical protein HID58_002688 [Brassica napus]
MWVSNVVLVALYEQNDKPSSALEFIQQKLGSPSVSDYKKLQSEKSDLQIKDNENFYMIGWNGNGVYRVLKIDQLDASELNLSEDFTAYTKKECNELLKRIHKENKATGGLKFVTLCYGIIGLKLSRKLLEQMNGSVSFVREDERCFFQVDLQVKTRLGVETRGTEADSSIQ